MHGDSIINTQIASSTLANAQTTHLAERQDVQCPKQNLCFQERLHKRDAHYARSDSGSILTMQKYRDLCKFACEKRPGAPASCEALQGRSCALASSGTLESNSYEQSKQECEQRRAAQHVDFVSSRRAELPKLPAKA
eukprot:705647-Pleurochrysis_carterae.AAC.3